MAVPIAISFPDLVSFVFVFSTDIEKDTLTNKMPPEVICEILYSEYHAEKPRVK